MLIFQFVSGVKGQTTVQNDKKFCLPHSISQEPLPFIVQMCKMRIYSAVFFNFKILIFCSVRGLKGQKSGPKQQKFLSLLINISRQFFLFSFLLSFSKFWFSGFFCWYTCKMMISPEKIFVFQNFDFWGFWGIKGQKMT